MFKKILLLTLLVSTNALSSIFGGVEEQVIPHVNRLSNGGFEKGTAGWSNTGGTRTAVEDATGNYYLNWDASAADQFVEYITQDVPLDYVGATCRLEVKFTADDALNEYRVTDENNNLITKITTSSVTQYTKRVSKFTCPAGKWKVRIYSLGDAAALQTAYVYLGLDYGGGVVVSPVVESYERSIGEVGAVANDLTGLVAADFPSPSSTHIYNLRGNADDSTTGTAVNLTVNGGLLFNGRGFLGEENIANFDGVDDYLSSSDALFKPTSSFSTGGFFNVTDADLNSGAYVYLMNTWPVTNRRYHVAFDGFGNVSFGVSSDGTAVAAQVLAPISVGRNHIAAVFDDTNDEIVVYINGKRSGSAAFAGTLFASTADFELGRRSGNAQHFSGTAEDVFFAQEVLTDSTFNPIYSKQFTNHPQIAGGHILTNDSFPFDDLTGKVVYWNLNDVNDDSVNGINLTNTGSVPFTGLDIYGESRIAEFDGTAKYLSSNNALFDRDAKAFTVGAMVNAADWTASRPIITDWDGANNDKRWLIQTNGANGLHVLFSTDGTSVTDTLSNNIVPDNGTWHHVVLRYDGAKNASLFVDGIKRAFITLSSDIHSSSDSAFTIGSEVGGAGGKFIGRIQDGFFYADSLSDQDILKLASAKLDLVNAIEPESQDFTASKWKREDGKILNHQKTDWIVDQKADHVYVKPVEGADRLVVKLKDNGLSGATTTIERFIQTYATTPPNEIAHGLGAQPLTFGVLYEGQNWASYKSLRHDVCDANATNLKCNWDKIPSISETNKITVVASAAPDDIFYIPPQSTSGFDGQGLTEINIVDNAGFESGTTGWSKVGTGTFTIGTADMHRGDQYAEWDAVDATSKFRNDYKVMEPALSGLFGYAQCYVKGGGTADITATLMNANDTAVTGWSTETITDAITGDYAIVLLKGIFPKSTDTLNERSLAIEFTSAGNAALLKVDSCFIGVTKAGQGSAGGWKVYDENDVTFSNTPAGWSSVVAELIPYKDPITTKWRLKFNISAITDPLAVRDFNLNGISATAAYQACSHSGDATGGYCQVDVASKFIVRSTTAIANVRVSGDIALDSKPTWADFDGTVQLVNNDYFKSNGSFRTYGLSSGQVISDITTTTVTTWNTPIELEGFTYSSGIFTSQFNGKVNFKANIRYSGTVTGTIITIGIYKNTTLVGYKSVQFSSASSPIVDTSVETDVVVGDEFIVQVYQNTGGNLTLATQPYGSYFTASRVSKVTGDPRIGLKGKATSTEAGLAGGSGGVEVSSGEIGEELSAPAASSITTITQVLVSTTGQNITNAITLTPGIYLVGYTAIHEADASENLALWIRNETTNDAVTDSITRSIGDATGDSEFKVVSYSSRLRVTSTTDYRLVGSTTSTSTRVFGYTNSDSNLIIQGTSGQDQNTRFWAIRIK